MRIKSYFAGTVEAAMDLARRELGEDAVLLNSRVAPAEAKHLGYYEVVFGVEAETAVAPPPAARAPAEASPALATLLEEIRGLRQQIERLEQREARPLAPPPPDAAGEFPARAPLVRFLTERAFAPGFAARIAGEVDAVLAEWVRVGRRPEVPTPPPDRWRAGVAGVFAYPPGTVMAGVARRGLVAEAVLTVLAGHLRCEGEPEPGRRRVIAVVGPPGAGKTTTLAKLAAVYGLGRQMDTAILSTDTIRIAAAEQLRTYAAILGLPFELVENPRGLADALAAHARRGLVLIDTPGWNVAGVQDEDAGPWRAFLAGHGEMETHLVLPATLGAAEWRPALRRFRAFGATRLILTHADAVTAGGALMAPLAESELPVSFLGYGQSVPEDLEAASAGRLLDLTFAEPGASGDAGEARWEQREDAEAEKSTRGTARTAGNRGTREFTHA